METALDLSRWRTAPKGIWHRRWVIVSLGVRQLMRLRFFRTVLFVGWAAAAAIAATLFIFSQSVATGGWLETVAARMGPRAQALASALGGLILLYPDICIKGLYTLLFWLQSFVGFYLSLIGLTLIIPRLVTRDRASNALTIYLARPLTTTDYLLGKLGIIVALLALVWTGPLVAGWLLSLLLAGGKDFLVYSVDPFLRALAYNGIALAVLAAIGLGVSALFRASRNTISVWIGLWLVAGFIALFDDTPEWLRRASFTHDLGEVRKGVFRVSDILNEAGSKLPLFDREFAAEMVTTGAATQATDFQGSLVGLSVMIVLSSLIFFRKIRNE
jgi:ABC-2 type transport system permease protein